MATFRQQLQKPLQRDDEARPTKPILGFMSIPPRLDRAPRCSTAPAASVPGSPTFTRLASADKKFTDQPSGSLPQALKSDDRSRGAGSTHAAGIRQRLGLHQAVRQLAAGDLSQIPSVRRLRQRDVRYRPIWPRYSWTGAGSRSASANNPIPGARRTRPRSDPCLRQDIRYQLLLGPRLGGGPVERCRQRRPEGPQRRESWPTGPATASCRSTSTPSASLGNGGCDQGLLARIANDPVLSNVYDSNTAPGKYYSAADQAALRNAFETITATILRLAR